MILIRGIKGEAYARRIEKGIVDCRDMLSALLQPPVTGYEYIYLTYFHILNEHSLEWLDKFDDDYMYLGGKAECEGYIKRMVKCKPKDIYVNRTIRRKYKMSDIPDAVYFPGYQKVEY